jgi:hypothetical protein
MIMLGPGAGAQVMLNCQLMHCFDGHPWLSIMALFVAGGTLLWLVMMILWKR